MRRIMVVDDETQFLEIVRKVLGRDYEVEVFDSPLAALERASAAAFDVVISDYRMPQMDGARFLTIFKERQPGAARIILSAHADKEDIISAVNEAQIYRFLSKPCDIMELRMTIAQAISHHDLTAQNLRLAEQVKSLTAEAARLRDELARIEKERPGTVKTGV